MNTYNIVVCGDSFFMNAIIEGLHSQCALRETRVDLQCEGAVGRIAALAPDAIILEAQLPGGEVAFTLLQQGFPLIVLDPDESVITVMEGRRMAAGSLVDLERIITRVILETRAEATTPAGLFERIPAEALSA